MTNELQILTNLGTQAAQVAIEAYTGYFIWSSIVWIIFGILIAIAGFVLYKPDFVFEEDDLGPRAGCLLVCLLIGVVIIFSNLGDLVSPKAMAIHQLIMDVKK